jgi:hypothetical protein
VKTVPFAKGTYILEVYDCPYCGGESAHYYVIAGTSCAAQCIHCAKVFRGVYSHRVCEILCTMGNRLECLVDGLPAIVLAKTFIVNPSIDDVEPYRGRCIY